jgi:hypothetical protein
MSSSLELLLFVACLHLAAMAVAGALIVMMFRSGRDDLLPPSDDGGDGRGGIEPRKPQPGSPLGGGPPLPTAIPARVRLREPGRLGELRPKPDRRPAREPERPRRSPATR